MSRARPATYEAVETGYDPGQHVASDDASSTPSLAPSKARTTSKPAARHDYKPTALRWWFQAFLVASLAVFIGLTEYTIRTLQAYNGEDLASQLWSREDIGSYREVEKKSGVPEPYFQRLPRSFGNVTTKHLEDVGLTSLPSALLPTTTTLAGGQYISSWTYLTVSFSARLISMTEPATSAEDAGRISTSSQLLPAATLTGLQTQPGITFANASACQIITTTVISVFKRDILGATLTGSQTQTDTTFATTSGCLDGERTNSTMTTIAVTTVLPVTSYIRTDHTTVTSVTSAHIQTQQTSNPTSPTKEADTTAIKKASSNIQIVPTLPSTIVSKSTSSIGQTSGSQPVSAISQDPGQRLSVTLSVTETRAATGAVSSHLQVEPTSSTESYATLPNTYYLHDEPTSSTKTYAATVASTHYHQIESTSSPTSTTKTATSDENAGLQGSVATAINPAASTTVAGAYETDGPSWKVSDPTATSVENTGLQGSVATAINPAASTTVAGAHETDGPSGILSDPTATSILQETAAGETPILTVVQETKTWAPSESWIEQTTTDSKGRGTVQAWTTLLPGSTQVSQSTMPVPSDSNREIVTVIQQTETWASSETTVEHTTTLANGETIVQALKTMLPGGTETIQSTIAVTPISEPSEGMLEDVTVIQQTETWPSTVVIIEETRTDADGQIMVQTLTTTSPGGTRIVQSSVSVHPGETLVTVPTVMPTTIGAVTEIVQTTFSDSQGHMTTSSYTTVLGGTPTFITRSFFVATSLPPEATVITIPSVIPTTLGGTTEVEETTFTDSHGSLTTSSYTTIIGGTPTSTTISVVIATPVLSGDVLVNSPTIVPTTIGGTTEVEETTFSDSHGSLTTSSYTTIIGGTPTSTTISVVIATPVLSGDVLVTSPTIVPTTIGGTTEVIQTTFTDSHGQLTTSSYITVLHGTPTSTTEWTIVPTPTYTGPVGAPSNNSDISGNTTVIVYGLSKEDYMLGTFLPTILTVLVAYPLKLISINARLMQPFHTLATADKIHGAIPRSSILESFDTWLGALPLAHALRYRQPVIAISDLLVLGAALLTPLAAETVGVHVVDGCQSHCFGSLGVSVTVGRILEALVAVMTALLIALIVLLSVFRWRTGVSQNPWSIAGMASLCLNSEIRDILRSVPRGLNGSVKGSEMLKVLGKNKYALGDFWIAPNPDTLNSRGYGVIVAARDGVARQLMESEDSNGEEAEESKAGYKRTQPFKLLTWWGRCLLIFVFSCILIILTYYENTSKDTGFERFMDSQGFGVNFFFTALGVVVGACMEMFFRSVAIISPYLQLTNSNLPAERSILLSPPTNAFYGIYSAFRQRHLYLGILSFTTILGELFLPVTLSQVPFSLIETYKTQLVCAWLSIAILALMILVLAASFFTTWPHMPVDPRTVAGAMFYVCDSWMLETIQGMSTMSKKDRDLDVRYLRLRYRYGYISGAVSGKERMGVEVCDDTGEAAVIVRNDKLRYN